MTFDYGTINISAVQTRYRDRVREVIPDSIQQQVRNACGDVIAAQAGTVVLRPSCPIVIDPSLAASTARELRGDPTLKQLLGQHRSAISAFLSNLELFDGQEQILARSIRSLGD
jgi:hypothetical protein